VPLNVPLSGAQAMDRAHRIGQRRVVNVYRLVTRDTLEEKIMSTQAFKRHVAATVVNQQNAALSTMNTHELLDLFELTPARPADATTRQTRPYSSVSCSNVRSKKQSKPHLHTLTLTRKGAHSRLSGLSPGLLGTAAVPRYRSRVPLSLVTSLSSRTCFRAPGARGGT
jgi:hypothetical protein